MRQTQEHLAAIVAVDQSTISRIELGRGANVDLRTWVAIGDLVGLDMAFIPASTDRVAAGHALIASTAMPGGWAATTTVDEMVLQRGPDRIVVHVWDRVTSVDVDTDRLMTSVAREEAVARRAGGRASGLVVIPTARGNRRRISELRFQLRDIFTAPGRAWHRCLIHPALPMPSDLGILWAFADLGRLRPAPDLPGWIWTTVGDRPRYMPGRHTRSARSAA